MRTIEFVPHGICARKITVVLDDQDVIQDVAFDGGCIGNHNGIIRLVKGRKAGEIADILSGTTCGFRPTSCPDQLAVALRKAVS